MKNILMGLCLTVPAAVMAGDFSYDYVAAGYANVQGDGDLEADFYGLQLAWSPVQAIYTRFGAAYGEVEDSPLEENDLSATLGGYVSLTDNVDIYVGGTAAWSEVQDVPLRGDVDGYGLGAEVGIRAWLFPQLELDLRGAYLDLFEGDFDDAGVDTDDFTAAFAVRVYPMQQFSIGGGYGYAFDAETDTYTVDLRYDF